MLPWQLKTCIDAAADARLDKHDHFAWFMWHMAALFRFGGKKLPDLSTFMSKRNPDDKKAVAGVNEDAIMAWLVSAKNKHQEKAKK